MMIDFHTHIFPEKIAGKTLEFLSKRCQIKPHTNGTAPGLLMSAEESETALSVVLPVVTKPEQFDSINRFAGEITENSGKRLLSFGGIHPENGDPKARLRQIKEMGLLGIKLHPAYQGTDFNDIRYKRILAYASELDLIVVVHAGFDPGYPNADYCTSEMAREVIDEVQPSKLVLAHMGGFMRWNAVERDLAGANVWFDTAAVFGVIEEEQFLRICRKHGANRILFGTDSPWSSQKASAECLREMKLTEEEKSLIFEKNARNLLTL